MRAQSIIIRAEMINFNLLAIVEKRRYKVACKRSGNTVAKCSARAESEEGDRESRKAQARHRSSVLWPISASPYQWTCRGPKRWFFAGGFQGIQLRSGLREKLGKLTTVCCTRMPAYVSLLLLVSDRDLDNESSISLY